MKNLNDELTEAEIARLIQDDYADAQQQARVPPAELVWMRAQLRARSEAARRAALPILIAQSVGVAAFAGLLVSMVSRFPVSDLPQVPLTLVEVVVGSWLALAPLAVYLALSRE
jgi:hypothetical protein